MVPRLAIVLSHPTQYYSPWFAYLAKLGGLELRVFYLWDFGVTAQHDQKFGQSFQWDVNLVSGYDHEFVPNVASDPGTHHFTGLNNPGILSQIDNFAPAFLLLFGYRYQTHLRVIRAARKRGWKLIFRGDSHLLGHPPPALPKRLLLKYVFSRFDAFLYVGEANRRYFKQFGAASGRLHFAPHTVDAERFSPLIAPAERAKLRHAIGFNNDELVVLFSGKMHPEKAPQDLLRAFQKLDSKNTWLVLAGDGEQREILKREVGKLGLKSVKFLPFANQSEMPQRYAIADLFVLPSTGLYETWGLAVNEAMHGSIPCIVSDRVGCHLDLIDQGKTGWVFPAGDVDALAQTLGAALEALRNPAIKQRIQSAIADRINRYTYAQASHGLQDAIRALQQPSS